MTEIAIVMLSIMLYFAIGLLLETLLSSTEPSFIMVVLWPLAILLVICLYLCVVFPTRVANWFRKRRK